MRSTIAVSLPRLQLLTGGLLVDSSGGDSGHEGVRSEIGRLAPVTQSDASGGSDRQQTTATNMLLTEKTEQNVIVH